MPDITNPQAVRFANEQARVIADLYAQLYYAIKVVEDIWVAQNIASVIPSTADVIIDGASQDGRATITGTDVNNLIGQLNLMSSDLEATANQKLKVLLRIAVNPGG